MTGYPPGMSVPQAGQKTPSQTRSTLDPSNIGSPIIGNGPSSSVQNILSTGSPLTPPTGPENTRKDVPQP